MKDLMISVSGIRGIYGKGFNPQVAATIAAHFGLFCGKGKIVVGRDARTTGLAMYSAISSGLISVGCDVIDLGVVGTPTVLLATLHHKADGGISITASHNPPQWNAMKFVDKNGMFLFPEKAEKFITTLNNQVEYVDWMSMGEFTPDDGAVKRQKDKIGSISYINIDEIRAKSYKDVIDNVNGAGGVICRALLKRLGCEVVELNTEPTGVFAHNPEPLAENLSQLEKEVKKSCADIGFATDPDVDRLSIVDECGRAIGEELSLLLSMDYILSKKKGDVAVNLSTSMASDDITKKYGVKLHRTKVGEINVGKKMVEIGSPIGGEGNGGVICADVHYTRDASCGMILVLASMAQSNQNISQLASKIPKYHIFKDKIEVKKSELDSLMKRAELLIDDKNFLHNQKQIDKRDGIKFVVSSVWVHLRKSGTEPIIRVYSEAKTLEQAKDSCNYLKKSILKANKKDN